MQQNDGGAGDDDCSAGVGGELRGAHVLSEFFVFATFIFRILKWVPAGNARTILATSVLAKETNPKLLPTKRTDVICLHDAPRDTMPATVIAVQLERSIDVNELQLAAMDCKVTSVRPSQKSNANSSAS